MPFAFKHVKWSLTMHKLLKKIINKVRPQPQPNPALQPNGALDYREYVGGHWDHMGRLQISYLMEHGLQPHHYLLDVACGSLRAGRYFILYLQPGHYYGLD